MIEPQKFSGYLHADPRKHLPKEVLWDRVRMIWEQNEAFKAAYGVSGGRQPLPVKAIENFLAVELEKAIW